MTPKFSGTSFLGISFEAKIEELATRAWINFAPAGGQLSTRRSSRASLRRMKITIATLHAMQGQQLLTAEFAKVAQRSQRRTIHVGDFLCELCG
jgi:hypothetical protein